MKTKTNLKIVLSISEMESLIKAMKENLQREPVMSPLVCFSLVEDSDYNALRLDPDSTGKQFSSYAECNSCPVSI